MIPKVIHYCWFGGNPLSPKAEACILSWKEKMPAFAIKEWNETNFDIHCCRYVQEAYAEKKYAFVADYVRFWALYHFGGIYLDSDVEAIKPLDRFLDHAFFTGFECKSFLEPAVMGAVKEHPINRELLDFFENRSFYNGDGSPDLTPLPKAFTAAFLPKNLAIDYKKNQVLEGNIGVYARKYFSPMNPATFKYKVTKNTYTVHKFTNSWRDQEDMVRLERLGRYERIFGESLGRSLAENGIFKTIGKAVKYPFERRKRRKGK